MPKAKAKAMSKSTKKKAPRSPPATAFAPMHTPTQAQDPGARPVQELRRSIETVTSEISRVRDRARNEAESLERIRAVLDVGPLNELMSVLGQLESRIGQLEKDALAAGHNAEHWRIELNHEQERLRKLWDAYVTQEDELRSLKDDLTRSQDRVGERDRLIHDLQRELAQLRATPDMRARVQELEKENAQLHKEFGDLSTTLRKQEDELARAHTELANYEKTKIDKKSVDGLKRELDAERERLAKLYKVYEETESKLKAAMSELGEWRAWFQDNREYFQAVGKAAEIKART